MFKWLTRRKKSANTETVLSEFFAMAGSASWFKKDYMTLAREGYIKNVVTHRCIKGIADAAADVPFFLKVKDQEVEKHPILDMLKRPNPQQAYKTFMRTAITHRLIHGNSYILGTKVQIGKQANITELTLLRPDRVVIELNRFGELMKYVYSINNITREYEIDPFTLISDVLHIKEINPVDDLYGLSPISVAAMGIDQHNESGEWNKKLLENSARPPGVLVMKDKSDSAQQLTAEQKAELRDEVNKKLSGYTNAGKVPILTWDMEWRSMGMSPADMEWMNARATTAREICQAFGYPAHLLGQTEGSTFNNVAEAKLSFYEETVIPLLQSILEELSHWLSSQLNQQIEIVADLDQVSALSLRREVSRKNTLDAFNAGLISLNEGREELGYDPKEGGDEPFVPAAKLPLNFDLNSMNKEQFAVWLIKEGYEKNSALKIADNAYALKSS